MERSIRDKNGGECKICSKVWDENNLHEQKLA